mmetsp:Transcript_86624/g.223103  ORF Transcript_86624/g.223103 Transcript_86624/m.223103 type:complete len:342 (-) Transcript_86624:84-1109(-)
MHALACYGWYDAVLEGVVIALSLLGVRLLAALAAWRSIGRWRNVGTPPAFKLDVACKQGCEPAPFALYRAAPRACLRDLSQDCNEELAGLLALRDLGALGAASAAERRGFWCAAGVWRVLAAQRGAALPRRLAGDDGTASMAAVAREAFRTHAFRVDLRRLNALGAVGAPGDGHTAVLREAAHVACGLMPYDGAAAAEALCRTAETALQRHHPARADSAAAANDLLRAAKRRGDVFRGAHVERLEAALGHALQLQGLMDMVERCDNAAAGDLAGLGLEAVPSGYLTPPQLTTPHPLGRCSPVWLADVVDVSDLLLEEAYEESRKSEMETLFSALFEQSAGT